MMEDEFRAGDDLENDPDEEAEGDFGDERLGDDDDNLGDDDDLV